MPALLVVDDEHDILLALRNALEDEGYKVVALGSGRAALEHLAAERPPLVILDVMMPFVSGLEVLDVMRATPRLADVPVVLMSAAPLPLHAGEGHSGFLKKPFSLEQLLELVGRLLGVAGGAT